MKIKTKIAIVGSFTIDLLTNKGEQLGGPPLYSGFAIYMLGGQPIIYSMIEKRYKQTLPSFLSKYRLEYVNSIPTFELIYDQDGTRKLILRKKNEKNLDISLINCRDIDGIIINPVCKELNTLPKITKPVAIDIQGFVRLCEPNKEVKIIQHDISSIFTKSKNLAIFHANYQEIGGSKMDLHKLYDMGFNEILISYDEDGFILHSKGLTVNYRPSRVGEYKVGTGDILLASYFILRLNGTPVSKAVEVSGKFVEWFSSEGYRLLFHR